MKSEFVNQYAHTWKVFSYLVNDFSAEGWIHIGRGAMTPARLSLHILQATKYYIEDQSITHFASGIGFDIDSETAEVSELPTKEDILDHINKFSKKTEKWLIETDYQSTNRNFPWAGKTKLGVVVFLLKHCIYHLGELSALLNESRNGEVEDNYVKALKRDG